MADDIMRIVVNEYGSTTDDPEIEVYKSSDGLVRFKLEREIRRCQHLQTKEKDPNRKIEWGERIKVMELLLALADKLG